MYLEINISDTPAGIEAFWQKVLEMNIHSIKIDVCVTSGTVTGTNVLWQGQPGEYLGVKVALLDKLEQWGSINSSEITDSEFDEVIDKEVKSLLSEFEQRCPANVSIEAAEVSA